MTGVPRACRRTAGIVDRMLDDGLGGDDRLHLESCPVCAVAIAEARRFEIALSRSAGGLVEEPLPRSALDAPPLAAPRGAWGAPAFLLVAAAVVTIAVFATLSLVNLGRNVGSPAATPRPLAASLAVPGMSVEATKGALIDLGMACEPNVKEPAGLRCTGHDPRTGATLYASVNQAGPDGVAELKASMSVPEPRGAASKAPAMAAEPIKRGASDEAFLAFFEPLIRLPWANDLAADTGDLDGFVKATIGGVNGSCQCQRRIGEVRIVLEGAVGWSWDLLIARR